jgi:hypothetical protein
MFHCDRQPDGSLLVWRDADRTDIAVPIGDTIELAKMRAARNPLKNSFVSDSEASDDSQDGFVGIDASEGNLDAIAHGCNLAPQNQIAMPTVQNVAMPTKEQFVAYLLTFAAGQVWTAGAEYGSGLTTLENWLNELAEKRHEFGCRCDAEGTLTFFREP